IFFAPFIAMTFIGWGFSGRHPLGYGIGLAGWILAFVATTLVWSLRLSRQARRIFAEETAAGTQPLPETPLVRVLSRWSSTRDGRQWHRRWSLLGLPLIDINLSSPESP